MSATVTGGVVTTPDQVGPGAAATQVPAVRTRDAALAFGDRVLWEGLNLDIAPGQFVAILGSNGSGKTSLLKVLLGEQPLTSGQAWIGGEPVRRGSTAVGYVPQKISIDEGTMLKARDLVRMGLDGHRWGFPFGSGRVPAGRPRPASTTCWPRSVRPASATRRCPCCPAASCNGSGWPPRWPPNPSILLCDEPLAALDLRHQQEVAALLDRRRRRARHRGAVRHPRHQRRAGLRRPGAVPRRPGSSGSGRRRRCSPRQGLTELYGAPVDVLHAQGRLIVVASTDPSAGHHLSEDDNCAVDHRQPDFRQRIGRSADEHLGQDVQLRQLRRTAALLQNSIIAGALLGLIGGLIGVFVMMRDLTFAVHGISELSFAGASFALLVGFNVVVGSILGSLIAALVIGVLGVGRGSGRRSSAC